MKSRKSLSCGTRCIKYVLVVFNLLFLVSRLLISDYVITTINY